jgi:hypothetical protein
MEVQSPYTALHEYNPINSHQFKANITRKKHHVIKKCHGIWYGQRNENLITRKDVALVNFTLITMSIHSSQRNIGTKNSSQLKKKSNFNYLRNGWSPHKYREN